MKTNKKIIGIILFMTFYCLDCYAQQMHITPTQEKEYHKKSIDTTAYIFEGKVIQQECFYGGKLGILTCSIIEITKIYKGNPQIKLGTIKVITKQGGQVGDGPIESISDGSIALYKNYSYIIFGRNSDVNAVSSITTDNKTAITMMNCDNPVCFIGKNSARWGLTYYKKVEDLYAFFKENGLTVQEEVEKPKKTKAPADSTN